MKEQWKKHDSDAKLIQNVEEGRPQPIKIELPISALGFKQDGCCNRLITLLRIAVLFVLLLILSLICMTLYSKYYSRLIVTDENTEQLTSNQHDYSSEENKLSFRKKVYAMVNEQDVASNEIDSFTTTSTSIPTASFELSGDNAFGDERMQFSSFHELLRMKNFEENENKIKNELQNIRDTYSLQTKLHDYIYKERFNLENVPEPKSAIEDVVSMVDNSSVKELGSDKEGSMEVLKNSYESVEENESNEITVTPSLEDKNTLQADEDVEKYMELEEADDLEQLINDIASAIGVLEEPSSEIDQLNEFIAVVQEEIKNNEENLEVTDLDKVSSAEEKSREESVAIVQEEIKSDGEDVSTVYLVDFEPISEEDDPNTEGVAVIQEEIKNDSGDSFKPEIIETNPLQIGDVIEANYKPLLNLIEDNPTEKSQEKVSSEDTSLNNLDKNISQDMSSVEDSETMNSPKLSFKPVDAEDFAILYAKILEPFVGEDYDLVHWYYNVFMDPSFVDDSDKKKVYAAKILYNQNITEYDIDMLMWLNEISENFSDLINPQNQIIADTFLQKQIANKLLAKFLLKAQYDLNMITFTQVWEMIDLSNSNHIKSWFLATHPSVRERELIPNIVASMDHRRKLYPMIKDDMSAVRIELIDEDTELKLLNFDYDDFNEEPVPSVLEQHLILNKVVVINKLLNQEKVDEMAEQISEETKLTGDYLPDNENEATDYEYQWKQLQQAISKQQKIIEAMKRIGEEYEDTEETTSSLKNHDEIELPVQETSVPIIETDDLNDDIAQNSDQSESSNTNLNPTKESEEPEENEEEDDPYYY